MQQNFRFKAAELGVFAQEASQVMAGLQKGAHIIGLTMGEYSLIDMIRAALDRTGPADVYIATWSAGIKDVHQVRWMMDTKLIRRIRILTDHSYVTRQKKYAASITELFGAENIRCSEMHAKFVLIRNDGWNVAIVSSMNLNANRTCETFVIYESADVVDFYMRYIEHHFDNLAEGFDASSARATKAMEDFFRAHDAAPAPIAHWSEM